MSMSCPLAEFLVVLILSNLMGRYECSRAATTKNHEHPPWFVGTRTRRAGPRLRGTALPRWITRKVHRSLPPALICKSNRRRPSA